MARKLWRTRSATAVISLWRLGRGCVLHDVEALARRQRGRAGRSLDVLHFRTGWPRSKQALELRERLVRPADEDLHVAVRQVTRVSGEAKRARMPGDEPSEPDPLHQAGYQETRAHAGRLRRAL